MTVDLQALLGRIRMDQAAQEVLRSASAALMPRMRDILSDQHRMIEDAPELRGLFRDSAHLESVVASQIGHWRTLFDGPVDDAFAERAMRIGRLHFGAGLRPESYVASYAMTLSNMHAALLASRARLGHVRLAEAERLVSVTTRAAFLDQLLALEGYFQAQQEDFSRRLGQLGNVFSSQVGAVSSEVRQSVEQLSGVADSMNQGTRRAMPQVGAAVSAAGSSAQMILSVSAAAEELSSSIKQISEKVSEADRISMAAADKADHTDGLMQSLRVSGDEIGGVVELISDIASQTNLLAINASVEAARAGEAGKGFAVVAGEVKQLSMRISEATADITRRIEQMHTDILEAVGAIQDVSTTIRQMAEISSLIAVSIQQQKVATDDIARNAEATASGTDDMTRNVESVGAVMQQTEADSQTVMMAARGLKAQSETLQQQIRNFVEGIQAA